MAPIQMKLLGGDQSPLTFVDVTLSGTTVLVSHPDRDPLIHLHSWGVDTAYHAPGRTACVPVRSLQQLVDAPCELRTSGDLEALVRLARHSSADPARLSWDGTRFHLEWLDPAGVLQVWPLEPSSISALLGSQLVFAATEDAWEEIGRRTRLPLTVAKAAMNSDGFITVTAFMPQMVEKVPVDTLFRRSVSVFGCPASSYLEVASLPGFIWEGPAPPAPGRHRTIPAWGMTSHVAAGSAQIADRIESLQAAAVVWDSGLGRRMAVLAAIEQLELWPALVVCHPWGLWLWVRHLQLAGRVPSLADDRGDARLVTYHDVPHISFSDPSVVVFDEFSSPLTAAAAASLHHLDVLRDTPRIGVADRLPDHDEALSTAMGLLRPVEFDPSQPVVWRYPRDPSRRLRRHVDAFVVARRLDDSDVDLVTPLRRSSVAVLPAPSDLRQEMDQVLSTPALPHQVVHDVAALLSSGTARSISPKLVEAATRLRAAAQRGLTAAAWTRFERSANILARLLKPWPCMVQRFDDGRVSTTVTEGGHRLGSTEAPMLTIMVGEMPVVPTGLEELVVIDVPSSFDVLADDRADSPRKTTVLHIPRSLDDVAAVAAVRGGPVDDEMWTVAIADLRLRTSPG